MSKPYYITTAISYPNGRPHIGHGYEAIAADVSARFQRYMGRDVRFQTGTDEHGLKMAQKAREVGQTPKELADEMSSYFIDMCAKLNISHNRFLRTSEKEHHRASQAIWRAMEANDDLYLDRYEGWYSIRDEAYYDEKELIKVKDTAGNIEKLSPQGTPVEWTVEESWFFRLSKYEKPLLKLYREQTEFIQPESRRNEIMRFVEGGLNDLSISRTSFDWGVRVPSDSNANKNNDNKHVMYVWVDALTNYLTGLGYPDKTTDFDTYWPADVHLIGKDITRFHAVYWPAFLMSANIALPKHIFGHGFLLNKGEKMSKSIGNVVDPIDLADAFGADQLRYFLLADVNFGQDGSYSAEAITLRCNADLANSYGNLAQRTLSMIFKNLDGKIDFDYESDTADDALCANIRKTCQKELPNAFEKLMFSQGIEAWMRAVNACNQYVDDQAPWNLKKTNPERMKAVLMTLFAAIRDLTIAINPVIPEKSAAILNQMNISGRTFTDLCSNDWKKEVSGFTLDKPIPAFPRLEMPTED